jgi:hypothetical protein
MAAGFVGYDEGGLRAAFVFSNVEISNENFFTAGARTTTLPGPLTSTLRLIGRNRPIRILRTGRKAFPAILRLRDRSYRKPIE